MQVRSRRWSPLGCRRVIGRGVENASFLCDRPFNPIFGAGRPRKSLQPVGFDTIGFLVARGQYSNTLLADVGNSAASVVDDRSDQRLT